MSESEAAGVARRRRRRGSSPAALASLPYDDDMLREILLRALPPQPSSLPRASAVCKRWRRIVTDPKFRRQFCAHHGKPPLLGVFERRPCNQFRSILDPPDRIPPERFDLRRQTGASADLLGCRHGRVLLMDSLRQKVIVCDPITGEHHHIHTPSVFIGFYIYGAVLCAATDHGHVHGNCHSSPFKVVLMSLCRVKSPMACVYSSETGVWGNLISTTDRCVLAESNPGVLVGNVLYWSSKSVSSGISIINMEAFTDDIIEFHSDRESLAVIKGPPALDGSLTHQIIKADNGDVGLAILSQGRVEMWQRKVNCDDGATWLLTKTIEMNTVLGFQPQVGGSMIRLQILGYDEDNGAIIFHGDANVYMVQLISMQFRKLYKSKYAYKCFAFTSFYAPAGGCDGAEMLPGCLV